MVAIRHFFKKYEFVIIIAVTLLLIYGLVLFSQKINFFLGNELVVNLSPNQVLLSMHYGETKKAEFNISIDNAAYCKAICSYTFSDRSRNELIDKNEFEIGIGQHFSKSYDVSVKRQGSGQDIYSFGVNCRSKRSFFCLTNSNEKERSSLVLANYDLTETEKALKQVLKQNVTKLLGLLSETDIAHQKASQKYFELAHNANLYNLTGEKIKIDSEYDTIRISVENLRSLWSVENYIRLNQRFNESYFEELAYLNNLIRDLDNKIDEVVVLHNFLLSELNKTRNDLENLNSILSFTGDKEALSNFTLAIAEFNNVASSMTNNTFDSYDELKGNIAKLNFRISNVSEQPKEASESIFFGMQYLLNYEKDLLCSLRLDCSENFSIENPIAKTKGFIQNYPDATLLKDSCNSIMQLEQSYSNIRNELLKVIEENNITFPADEKFLNDAAKFKQNLLSEINNSYFDSFQNIINENKTSADVFEAAGRFVPKNKASLTALEYNSSINISLYLLSAINVSQQTYEMSQECRMLHKPEPIENFNFEHIKTKINYSITKNVDTILSDNPPVCCLFNECNACCMDESCKNDPKTFPVIFLHGHSFYKDNSPEYSLDAFNKLQAKLQDDGYLNAGIVSLYSKNEDITEGSWSLSGKPITVKVSYYYDAFRKEDKYIVVPTKSENIDAYALRLKDLVEIVKQRTGKPKVNIIAHSMGGLVARRYLQIFGSNDVDKLIMISTPNNGVSKTAGNYCGYVGENRECSDMLENSLFLNKLNDPSNQPSGTKLYAIIGQGCTTDSGNGDGVVTAESAELDAAENFYVNGTCNGLFGSLHTELLNTEKHPEVYNIIKMVMKD